MNKKRNTYTRTDEDGTVSWYDGDMLHRDDGPAVIHPNGDKHWWYEDLPHRVDGPADEYANGDQMWFIHGAPHRLDGPAVIITGPNIAFHPINYNRIEPNLLHVVEWWVEDEQVPVSSQEEFEKMMKMKVFW